MRAVIITIRNTQTQSSFQDLPWFFQSSKSLEIMQKKKSEILKTERQEVEKIKKKQIKMHLTRHQ